jgi:hypothetical protein
MSVAWVIVRDLGSWVELVDQLRHAHAALD